MMTQVVTLSCLCRQCLSYCTYVIVIFVNIIVYHVNDYSFFWCIEMSKMCVYVFVKKAQKTPQLPSLPTLTALGKNVPAAYTHILAAAPFDKGNNISLTLTD